MNERKASFLDPQMHNNIGDLITLAEAPGLIGRKKHMP